MKKMKSVLVLLLLVLIYSCSIPDKNQIAQNRIMKHLENIQKKDNYSPILFGKLDSAFTSVKDTKLYKEYNQRRGAFEAMGIFSKQFSGMYSEEEVKSNKEQEIHFEAICDSLESAFMPEFIGWKIQHIYKYKNEKSESVVDNFVFYLDNELRNIIKEEQVYKGLQLNSYNQDADFYGIK